MIKQITRSKSFFKFLSISLLFLGVFFFFNQFAQPVNAQLDLGTEFAEEIDLPDTDPRIIVARVIRIALGFLGILAVSLIIYAGWLYMTSEGEAEKINKAKAIMKNAAIGLLIIVSAFTIVSFILSRWEAGGGGGDNLTPGGGVDFRGGVGALGSCSVESVYPEDLAKDVPRNSAIIITFKEAVKPDNICQTLDNGKCNGGDITGNVKLFKQADRSSCVTGTLGITSNCVTDVKAYSTDNKTFVFAPTEYLGSATEILWYGIRFTNDIEKAASTDGIFKNCRNDYLEWQFEVSNKLDLTPPQVESIFPVADSQKDTVSGGSPAVSASGSITINNPNKISVSRYTNAIPDGVSAPLTISGTYNCDEDGGVRVSVTGNQIRAVGVGGLNNPASINGGSSYIGCGLTISSSPNFVENNSWSLDVFSAKTADTLTIGSQTYVFGTDIQVDASNNSITASNAATVLDGRADISAESSGATITVTSRVAGTSGNQINISSSNNTRLAVSTMSGGSDQVTTYTVNGIKDEPKNVIIQINFNEAVNPLTLSGTSVDLENYIRVASGTDTISGKFEISNGYRTVEFTPSLECGTNSCGDKIYCLPGDSEINVYLKAATLAACGADNCASKTPYNFCTGNHCQNNAITPIENYPQSIILPDGVTDLAFNSLDGNKNNNAEGPDADNYSWKFYTTNIMDTTPPMISSTEPAISSTTQNLIFPLELNFSKVLMSSSLRTGSTQALDQQRSTPQTPAYITHQHLNMWNFTNQPLGYWITKNNLETGNPDGVADYTQAIINHTMLADQARYRAQAGSGIRDIYQNCYAPSKGPSGASTCELNDVGCCTGVSCCNGASTSAAVCQ
jgi:hypothetical protein